MYDIKKEAYIILVFEEKIRLSLISYICSILHNIFDQDYM